MNFHYVFSFEHGKEESNSHDIEVSEKDCYSLSRGYGYASSEVISSKEDMSLSLPGDYIAPLYKSFVVDVPNGNYSLSFTIGDCNKETHTSVMYGIGHELLHDITTAPGQYIEVKAAVHVNQGQLRLAYYGEAPAVIKLEIKRDPSIKTIYLVGDSTVTNQSAGQQPFCGWGQSIARYFNEHIAISNHARSGASAKSFIEEERFLRVKNSIQAGDFLLIQFGHNDQKNPNDEKEPLIAYRKCLMQFIKMARVKGAIPVLITSVHRRFFDEHDKLIDTHGSYLLEVKQLAQQEQVMLIDLAEKSKHLYERYGPEQSKQLFVHVLPGQYANLPDGAQDNTHFNRFGAAQIAKLVIDAIVEQEQNMLQAYVRRS